MTPLHDHILYCVSQYACTMDELAEFTGARWHDVSMALHVLRRDGLVTRISGAFERWSAA